MEDAEIYLPGVQKILQPELFPFNAEFFNSHAHLTLFPNLIAASVRISHLSLSSVLLGWQLVSIFLLLLACWKLSGELFQSSLARWGGVSLIAALLTLPVAGTALYIVDQYTNPRNLAAFAAVFAVSSVLKKDYWIAIAWLAFAAAVHPLMAVFASSFCALLPIMKKYETVIAALFLPLAISFQKPSAAYHQAAVYHPFHYVLNWHWYEWIGIIAPLGLLWWFSKIARRQKLRNLELVCRALMIYDLTYFAGALLISIPARFESLARLQPLRSLHLLYIMLFLIGGGFLGEHVLQNRKWRWALLYVPLCLGMFCAQRALFPATPHIEWSLNSQQNEWSRAFVWVRQNTPVEAYFALDPFHMQINGEDGHGFRAIAERSMLADAIKDSGAVSMFPPLAEKWAEQVQAQKGWNQFQLRDFQLLQSRYGVNWVIVQRSTNGMNCPYKNSSVAVCRLD